MTTIPNGHGRTAGAGAFVPVCRYWFEDLQFLFGNLFRFSAEIRSFHFWLRCSKYEWRRDAFYGFHMF